MYTYGELPARAIVYFLTIRIHRIDVSIRLRRAIHLNVLPLVKRIIKNNPRNLQNPDFTDKGNTSLHLTAKFDCLDIAVRSFPPSFLSPHL